MTIGKFSIPVVFDHRLPSGIPAGMKIRLLSTEHSELSIYPPH